MRLAAIALLVAALAADARAAPTAEHLYALGKEAFDAQQYDVAIIRWRDSFALSHEPELIFNIAQAYRLSENCGAAIATYKQFVTLDPTSDERTFADDFIRELEQTCTMQTLHVEHPSGGRNKKIAGLVMGGSGVVMIVTGVAFGLHASTLGDEKATIGKVLDGAGIVTIAIGVGLMIYGVRDAGPTVVIQPHHDGATLSWSGKW